MSNIPYTSIDRILSKIARDYPSVEINESDVVEWTSEALEAIGAVLQYEEAVAFIEVKNHQCSLPNNFYKLIQIAKDTQSTSNICPKEILPEPENTLIKDFVPLKCDGRPLTDYDVAYYRPYYDLKFEHELWGRTPIYRQRFIRVGRATSSFASICNDNLNNNTKDTYTIIRNSKLRFSFREGSVAIAYLRVPLDEETGYPLIPDHYSYTTAITKYINMKLADIEFQSNREGSVTKLQKAESDWQWYCKQAGNYALMPKTVDDWISLQETNLKRYPDLTLPDKFFNR